MTTYKRGTVVVVEVSFSDGSGVKRRPALVVSDPAFHRMLPDVLVAPVSSQPRYLTRPGPGDVAIEPWKQVGLHHPSTVRVSKTLAVDKKIIRRVLGTMPGATMARVDQALRSALRLPVETPSAPGRARAVRRNG